jgi:hypothetical protein
MVELLGRYYNHEILLHRLQVLLEVKPVRSRYRPKRRRKQQQRRLSVDEQVQLIERYLSGERPYLLAEAFGIQRSSVSELLARTGVRRSRSMTRDEINTAKELYAQGWSLVRIGKRIDRDANTIRHALIAVGVRMRDSHGRQK